MEEFSRRTKRKRINSKNWALEELNWLLGYSIKFIVISEKDGILCWREWEII